MGLSGFESRHVHEEDSMKTIVGWIVIDPHVGKLFSSGTIDDSHRYLREDGPGKARWTYSRTVFDNLATAKQVAAANPTPGYPVKIRRVVRRPKVKPGTVGYVVKDLSVDTAAGLPYVSPVFSNAPGLCAETGFTGFWWSRKPYRYPTRRLAELAQEVSERTAFPCKVLAVVRKPRASRA